MANTDRVNGFKPVGTLSGGYGVLGYIQRCLKDEDDSTELAVGDVVEIVTSNESNMMPTVTAASAGDLSYGVCVGLENWDGNDPEVTQTLDQPRYIAGSKRCYVLVAIAPDLLMEVQSSGTFEDGDIGANGDLTDATPDVDAQTSGQEIDQSSVNTTNTLNFKILECINREDNALGANAKLLVMFNLHFLAGGADGTGSTGSVGLHA